MTERSPSGASQNGSIVPITAPASDISNEHKKLTIADLHGESIYAKIAKTYWLGAGTSAKVRQTVLKDELWDRLEEEDFAFNSLLVLENLQLLERYLWPGYVEDASNHHVLFLAILVNVKCRENLTPWSYFESDPARFSSFFRRALALTTDFTIVPKIRLQLITFIINAFKSLENGLIRKECAPLVSIAIWHNLHSESAKEQKLESALPLRKAWKAALKKNDSADDEAKAKLRFDRMWLYTLLLDFLNRVYDTKLAGQATVDNLSYCERFIEFLTDLLSQLPTRRYVNSLLKDLNLLTAIELSPMYKKRENGLFRDLINLFEHFTYFQIDDYTGHQKSQAQHNESHYMLLTKLQRIAFKHFNEKLSIFALTNFGSLTNREELLSHLDALDDTEMLRLCEQLGLRTAYPQSCTLVSNREFLLEIVVAVHEKKPTFQDTVRKMHVLPTEFSLYEPTFLRNETYDGSTPLAIPKLNLQYLTMGDFLWRSFVLHRCESFYEIRKDMEDVIKRLQPNASASGTRFTGFSKMAMPIGKPAILEVRPADVGESRPSMAKTEVIIDVSRLNYGALKEWDSLRPDDVVFLLAVDGSEGPAVSNGHSFEHSAARAGLKFLRAAEVIQVQDENGKPLRDVRTSNSAHQGRRPRQRRLLLKLDTVTYKEDMDNASKGKPNVYDSINLVVRRRGRENNFKPVLESIKRLTLSDIPAPSWLQEVFLGYSDPSGATYRRLGNRLKSIDFRDTFLDWHHLIESLPGKAVEPAEDTKSCFGPPYVLDFRGASEQVQQVRPSKKRRRDEEPSQPNAHEGVHVSTYSPPNMGPYPTDAPKVNSVRFTSAQVEAITSGTQPGLTVIVGPPGTGKTDVATQIINNIYHNFPAQRTLLVAHSNQALNQLFQKIVALDIDERHLLRLGHGEEELETEASYSKHGRVESFLDNGTKYLAEVNRLAATLGAPGAHGNSCETADYFNSVYVRPAWKKYWDMVESGECSAQQIALEFPFHSYFSNAPQPLFSPDSSKESLVDIVSGCYRHIEKIFAELEDIRPFEILRRDRDKANYLLVKEARIIAMTSTHAAMRRQEIAKLDFRYDNVIMEEAAQITEIENFIPLALQDPRDGDMPLQRVVLCGDHLQNSPIIQNLAFRQYANLEQSLFLRLVRLGVPTIMLDRQGRARPSIAELYKWRYSKLDNLPVVENEVEFQTANAGLRYEYQFVNVADYKGKGEVEPTPHFIQNLGEAEYVVAMFMFMRLLGYPSSKISILTTYAGQKALIKDVLNHRCAKNRLFGLPRIVTTVDKYQGEQNDYILLSLTRTRRIGYLRDIRRLTVALSRARLGLYIFGRREVFEACYELKEAFDLLFRRPDKLTLVTGEMYPTERISRADPAATEIESVEHLGQYVYEMTQAKVAALKANGGVLPLAEQVVQPAESDSDRGGVEADEPMGIDGPDDDEALE